MSSSPLPEDLTHVGDYDWPRAPATSTFKANLKRLRDKLRGLKDPKSDLMPEGVERVGKSQIPDSLWSALRDHQFGCLDKIYLDWARRTDGSPSVYAFVTMPSVPRGLLADWATARDLEMSDGASLPDGKGGLVVPDLGGLIRRNPEGRRAFRAYLDDLSATSRNVLLGVSSWSWTYLAQTAHIETVVSDARCFAPFTDRALAGLIEAHMPSEVFKSAESGKDILRRDGGGDLKDTYLKTLAARAYGCPWASFTLFDASFNRSPDPDEEADAKTKEETGVTWLRNPSIPELPRKIKRPAHFLIHALLLHGSLSPRDIAQVLPMTLPVGLSSALRRLGLVCEQDGTIAIERDAYPQLRRILAEAGFPLDQL